MANRKGLGVSKKYTKGSVHETATGRFVVLDRFAEEDDEKNTPMLELQWLSGDKEGKTEVNREMNMAASIHKFQSSRGLPTITTETRMIDEEITFVEKIDRLFSICSNLQDHFAYDALKVERINQTLDEVHGIKRYIDNASASIMGNSNKVGEMMKNVFESVTANGQGLEEAMTKIQTLNAVVSDQRETISQLTETVNKLLQHSTVVVKQQETMSMQQAILNKLIEKL
ncbi:hypothetical protein [Paenibacillus sp. OV219]|uniref:hypothetical protein n=1 Tax=Paenibacillus sp. OV219 TaxID=1884377 RepID=UPI0008C0EE3E|nr:hypothetical protein [Paenibacillus sp. OV219]SEN18709.1 hypothetical protein SAMN05518847_102366 [Paenibacillus sp. OV219]